MVFESIVAEGLNRFLGDYVENLGGKQLQIGIWGGDVVLQDLVLKQNALEDLDLPVQTIYGRLGKLVLKIPWKNLYGAPVEAIIDSLYLLVVPNQEVKYDPVKEERVAQESKQAELFRVEEAKRKEREKGKKKVDDSFIEKLLAQIIKNVQVKIKSIHIRYEDKVTHPNKPFSFGITLGNLTVETTDANWRAAIVQDNLSKIYKVLNLEAYAVYWNCNSALFLNLSTEEKLKKFKNGIATKDFSPENYLYIFGPINSSARLRINMKPENDTPQFSLPKVLLNLEMEKLALGISKCQYQDIMMLVESMDRMNKGLPYRKYRPVAPYKGNAALWWKFAYTCILEEEIKRRRKNWDWNHILEHRTACREYAQAYQEKLTTKKVPEEVRKKVEEYEKKLDLFNLVIVRQQIQLEVERIAKKTEEVAKNKSWFSGWWGKSASQQEKDMKTSADIMRKFEDAMTSEEKSKLFRAIDYQENSAPTEYPQEYVEKICAFSLKSLEIVVRDDYLNVPRVLSTNLVGVNCRLQQRPAASALKVGIKIDQFTVYGFQQDEYIPHFVSSKDFAEGTPLLDVLFETNPLDKTCSQRLHVKSQPIKVIYDAQTILKIIDIFKTPQELVNQLQVVAGNKLTDFKEMSATGMQYAIEQHTHVDVDINLSAPYIIVPHSGLYTGNENVLVVNLGRVKITSIERNQSALDVRKMFGKGSSEDEILKEVMSQSYDKFVCELSDIQVLLAKKEQDWEECLASNQISPMHILQPMSLTVHLNKCLVCDDPRLPKMKVDGELPSIMINITDDHLLNMLTLFASIPLPVNDEPLPLKRTGSRGSNLSVLFNIAQQPDVRKSKIQITPITDENLVQSTDLMARFAMKELVVQVSKKNDEPNEMSELCKLIKFSIINLELEMTQQTYNMHVDMRLGGIGLEQYLSNKTYNVISTPMTTGNEEYLLCINYRQVNKKSPEFHTKYQSCEQTVQLCFTSLSVLLHQEGIQKLLHIANDFQNVLGTEKEKQSVSEPQYRTGFAKEYSALSTITEELTLTSKSRISVTKPKSKKALFVETIGFKLVAEFKELNVRLASEARNDIASLAIKGISANIIVKKSYTQIDAELINLIVLDCNENTKHSQIICVIGNDNALTTRVIMYNLEPHETTKVNMSVTLTMGCLRILFLNCFVSRVLDFLNKFQAAQQAIIDAAAEAAEAARHNVQNMYQNATKIDLNIKMNAPDIVIPANTQSYSAMILDLGHLTITNRFINQEVENEAGQRVVIDDLNLRLKDLKLIRVLLSEDYINKYECVILNPISFSLWIKRNLSTSWYTNIPDIDVIGEMKAIELNLSQSDYNMMMQVLNENLAEGEPPSVPTDKILLTPTSISDVTSAVPKPKQDSQENINTPVHVFLKYTFTMESLIINLFKDGTKEFIDPVYLPNHGLAKFTLHILSLKGRIYTDNSNVTSILLVDCLLDDTRAGREGKLTRMMERNEDGYLENDATVQDTPQSMFDITFQQKDSETFIDLRIYSFQLIISMDYLMKIASFFTEGSPASKPPKPKAIKPTASKTTTVRTQRNVIQESTTRINLKIEKPDIILVECMDSIDVKALIMNTEMNVSIKMVGTSQTIRGAINDLQLYTCNYNPAKRKDTRSSVLRPCNITVMGITPEYEGLHLEIVITPIKLSVSPATIDLLNRVWVTFSSVSSTDETSVLKIENYSDIWNENSFDDSDFWFLKTEIGEDVIEIMSADALLSVNATNKELCVISAPSFIITMEAGSGKDTLPMLLLESSFDAQIRNWSSQMSIESYLTLRMGYYNNELAIWEPLIEPVEVAGPNNQIIVTPWELKLELLMNNPELDGTDSNIPDDHDENKRPPNMSINITSKVNLELVLTKTCLEVISNLGKAFQNAVKEGVITKDEIVAPYKVINESGLKLTLLLDKSDFDFFSHHDSSRDYKEVIVESGAEVPLQLSLDDSSNITLELGPGISSTYMLQHIDKKKLVVLVNDMKCNLELPVVRADKRYFSLNHRGENNDVWGIVSDITVEGAQTILTLRSMIKVFNHFDQPVKVYYMTNRGNELEFIKNVAPGSSTNLPLHAIYTLTNELFFSVEKYSVSTVPYIWKDLQLNLTMDKKLPCPSIDSESTEHFIMKACGEIEQIFHENTNRHTMSSTCYNIHLRPTVAFRNYLPIPVTCIVQGDVREKIVPPGETMHMPTVSPGDSYIVLKLINYLEKDWSCRRDVVEDLTEFTVLQFDSHDSIAKMILDLGMHCAKKNGTMLISLYCPFWMLNKTGLMLSYRNSDDNVNVLHHPAYFKGPILFSFSAKNFFGKKKASIRVENGEWSDKFSIDVAGSSGMVVCRCKEKIYQIGVHNQLTYNSLTKQITFTPYFVLINLAPFAIECQELERPADPWIKVAPDACTPLWPRSERDDKLLKIRVVDMPQQIAAPFFITEMHNSLLKLPNAYGGINVDVQITEGAVYITFTGYKPGLAPAVIINHTNKTLNFWEKESVVVRKIQANHSVLFTWENPTGPRLLSWESGKTDVEDDLRKDGLGELYLEDEKIYWVSFLDGMQRVLLFTSDATIAHDAQSSGDLEHIDQEINVSIHGLGLSLINNIAKQEILYMGIASTGIIWESCKTNSKRYKQLSVRDCSLIETAYKQYIAQEADPQINPIVIIDPKTEVDFKNLLMLKPHKRHLRRSFQTGLWIQMKSSPTQFQLHAKVNRVQIDNQMYDCIFPVVLAPVPLPKSVAADSALKPFVEVSIVQRIMKHSRVQQFKYFKVLIQEFHIKVDLGFINAVMSVLSSEERSTKEDQELFLKDMSLVDEPLLSHVSTQSLQEQKNFYDLLHFSPLKIHISFSLASQGGAIVDSPAPEFINVLLQGLGVTLTDMHDVVFRLAFFEREYTFLTQRQLTSEATSHYIDQAVKQLYVLVLGLDVIGNPYGLVLGLTKGVEDLFYEPFQGAIQGPGEFAEGLVLGVRSLFGHTVGGAAGAVSKITGAMGKGVAVLTFDKDYQRKRRDQINKKPANLQEGLARSGKGLVMGVVDGVTGVFTKPISGAKEQGVEGFFKGLGKGAVGLVTRPTAGVIDFASGSLDAVKRAAEISDEVTRLRPPRFMYADGLVRAYNRQEAEGNKLLMELEKGKYASTDVYSYHKWIIAGKDILLLTDKRLAYVVHNDIFGGWQIDWSYTWQDIQVPAKVVDRGVLVTTGEPKKKVLGLFGSGENGKLIIIPQPSDRELVKNKIEALRLR